METFAPSDFGIGRLFRLVRDAVVVGNARTEEIVLWNDAAEHVFGYTESEALGMPLHRLVPEPLRKAHRAGLAHYQETGNGALLDSGSIVELEGVHRDGHLVPVELTLTPIPDPGPNGDRFALAIIRDISERRAAEDARAQLRESELKRRQALELNDTIVQGLVVALMAMESGRPDQAEDSVRRTLQRARAIVTALLRSGGQEPGDLVLGGAAEEA